VKLRWDLVAIAYLVLAVLGAALSHWLHGGNPMLHPSARLALSLPARHALSLGLGIAAAAVVIATSRIAVARARWAQELHAELRPVAAGMSRSTILSVAALSSLGEELLFRSLVAPWLGVWAQGLIFGFLHQTRGRSRWVWMVWATLIGLGFGWIYASTGSLAGPLAAHFLINAVNLQFLRDHDPAAAPSISR
jgi:uncharacterized protein